MECIGVNSVFNPGAIEIDGIIYLVARVEGYDRKSFFAVAESETGIDGFRFWDYPVVMPETQDPDINVYDMRLTRHEDGFIYGLFCMKERIRMHPGRFVKRCRTVWNRQNQGFDKWERLPDS